MAAIALAAVWRVTSEIQLRAAEEEVFGLALVQARQAKRPASSLEKLKPLVAQARAAQPPAAADGALEAIFTPPPAEPEVVVPSVPPPPPCKQAMAPLLEVQALGSDGAVVNGRWTRIGEALSVAPADEGVARRSATLEAVFAGGIRVRCGRERFVVSAAQRAH
jgi:hypothetical protein